MVYTVVSLEDFWDMKITPNMKSIDYLLAVSEVSFLKSMYGEEKDTIAEQDKEFRIKKEEKITQNIRSILSSFSHVLDEKSNLDFVIPKKKRSLPKVHPREVTGQFLCGNGGESMIKKAVEHNSEEHRVVKDDWSAISSKFYRPTGVTVSDQRLLEYRAKTDDDRQNRGINIDYWSNVNKKEYRAKMDDDRQNRGINIDYWSNVNKKEYRAKTDDDRQNRGINIDYWNNVNKKEHRAKTDDDRQNREINIDYWSNVNKKEHREKTDDDRQNRGINIDYWSNVNKKEHRAKTDDDRQNRGINIDYWNNVNKKEHDRQNREINIDYWSNVNKKRSREVDFSNQEGFLYKEKPKKRNITARTAVVRPPVVIINRELSTGLKNQILLSGGSLESVKLVIEKTLFETDVKPAEGRFSIPQNKMSNAFLKPDEEQLLNMRNEANKMCEMNVMLIEPSYQTCEINLRKWTMNKSNGNASSSYVLVKHWNGVVRRNRLRSGMQMQLWAFRKDENLCFALVNV